MLLPAPGFLYRFCRYSCASCWSSSLTATVAMEWMWLQMSRMLGSSAALGAASPVAAAVKSREACTSSRLIAHGRLGGAGFSSGRV